MVMMETWESWETQDRVGSKASKVLLGRQGSRGPGEGPGDLVHLEMM